HRRILSALWCRGMTDEDETTPRSEMRSAGAYRRRLGSQRHSPADGQRAERGESEQRLQEGPPGWLDREGSCRQTEQASGDEAEQVREQVRVVAGAEQAQERGAGA